MSLAPARPPAHSLLSQQSSDLHPGFDLRSSLLASLGSKKFLADSGPIVLNKESLKGPTELSSEQQPQSGCKFRRMEKLLMKMKSQRGPSLASTPSEELEQELAEDLKPTFFFGDKARAQIASSAKILQASDREDSHEP